MTKTALVLAVGRSVGRTLALRRLGFYVVVVVEPTQNKVSVKQPQQKYQSPGLYRDLYHHELKQNSFSENEPKTEANEWRDSFRDAGAS